MISREFKAKLVPISFNNLSALVSITLKNISIFNFDRSLAVGPGYTITNRMLQKNNGL